MEEDPAWIWRVLISLVQEILLTSNRVPAARGGATGASSTTPFLEKGGTGRTMQNYVKNYRVEAIFLVSLRLLHEEDRQSKDWLPPLQSL